MEAYNAERRGSVSPRLIVFDASTFASATM